MIDTRPAARDLMACLGEPSRFRLVRVLIEGPRCVSDLALEVGLSQSCTTRHLQALEKRNVVRGTRDGKRVLYAIRQDRSDLMPLIAWAMKSGFAPVRAGARKPVQGRNGGQPARPSAIGPAGNGGSADAPSGDPAPVARPPKPAPAAPPTPELAARPDRPNNAEPEPSPRRRSGDLEDFLL